MGSDAALAREVARVRAEGGFYRRNQAGIFRVSGEDRLSWLQGMVSNDIRLLTQANPRLTACILDPAGHLLAVVSVLRRPDHVLVVAETRDPSLLFRRLDQLLILEDARIEDLSSEMGVLQAEGPGVKEIGAATAFPPAPCRGPTGGSGWEWVASAPELAAVELALQSAGVRLVSAEAAEVLRIEGGTPHFGVDMNERNLPNEAGLEPTHISHSKGCYVGQEIVARIQARGHTNRQLAGIAFGANIPQPGTTVYSELSPDRELGRITSAVFSPTLGQGIALAMLRHEARAPGTKLLASSRGESFFAGVVKALPFVVPGEWN